MRPKRFPTFKYLSQVNREQWQSVHETSYLQIVKFTKCFVSQNPYRLDQICEKDLRALSSTIQFNKILQLAVDKFRKLFYKLFAPFTNA